MKSVITKQPETAHKLSQDEKSYSNNSFYSHTKKSKKNLNKKNVKITKRTHAFKGYASTYNVEILNLFNLELQLRDIESAIKSKLI